MICKHLGYQKIAQCGLIHSNLDLGAVNLGVYLDLVANWLLTEILLIKNSQFRRFGLFLPKIQTLDLGVAIFINFINILIEFPSN